MVRPTLSGPGGHILAAIALILGCREPARRTTPGLGPQLGEQHATRAPAAGDAGQPHAAPIDRRAMVRFHMQWHFNDLRTIERMLLQGKLDEAKARAFLLSKPARDPGFAQWEAAAARVVEAALALSESPSLAEAYRREPRVAAECARCHLAMQRLPVFPPPPPPPPDSTAQTARMARHQWAADRLWEALVGDSELAWRGSLAVLAETPPPGDRAELAKRLQDLARRRQTGRITTLDERAATYGELLATCGACHAAR